MPNALTGNKGEWSELYAFIKLLKDGRIYAADEDVNRLDDLFFPILRIIREEFAGDVYDYYTAIESVKVYKDGQFINEVTLPEMEDITQLLFQKISDGNRYTDRSGSFSIDEIETFMEDMHLRRIKAPSKDKIDILMVIHDTNTGYMSKAGFSVKSDIGSPPTLLNPGKNTRIRYLVKGLNEDQVNEINGIDESVNNNYIKLRFKRLFELTQDVQYHSFIDQNYYDNLVMIDSLLPEITSVALKYQSINSKYGINNFM